MDQLSLPYRIALVALLAVAAVWFTVLKPGTATTDAPPVAPGVAGLSTAVDKAHGAVDTSAAANAKVGADAVAAPAAPATSAPATVAPKPVAKKPAPRTPEAVPGVAAGDPSADILRAVADGQVAVVLFHKAGASDDELVRRELDDLHAKKVRQFEVPVSRVADYKAITSGVKVSQAPTVLVIGRGGKTRTIVGLTDRREVDQTIADVRRSAGR